MGGKAMAAAPPAYRVVQYQHDMMIAVWRETLRSLVQEQFTLRIEMLRDLALDKYRIVVRIVNADLTLHGELEECVEDPKQFPSDTFRTQLIMLAG